MKITEFISALQRFVEEHGDQDVFAYTRYEYLGDPTIFLEESEIVGNKRPVAVIEGD